MSYRMNGMASCVKGERGINIGETFRVLYADDRYLGLETRRGDASIMDSIKIRDYPTILHGSVEAWRRYEGKYISWVNNSYWKIIDDPCGNCRNSCRAKEKCPFYQEE